MIYDISMTIQSPMLAWPGDPNVSMTPACSIAAGDDCNVTRISMGLHTGTHVDAPCHFIDNSDGVDVLALERFVGLCQVVCIENETTITGEMLRGVVSDDCTRLLIRTDNSMCSYKDKPFDKNFVALDSSAAAFMVSRKILLVGLDYLSVESFFAQEGNPVHLTLLQEKVAVLEGIYLRDVPPGEYELFAPPLKIKDADGAPCRAILRSV